MGSTGLDPRSYSGRGLIINKLYLFSVAHLASGAGFLPRLGNSHSIVGVDLKRVGFFSKWMAFMRRGSIWECVLLSTGKPNPHTHATDDGRRGTESFVPNLRSFSSIDWKEASSDRHSRSLSHFSRQILLHDLLPEIAGKEESESRPGEST